MDLKQYYISIKPEIEERLSSFATFTSGLWNGKKDLSNLGVENIAGELIFCLCTAQDSPLKAEKVLRKLKILAGLNGWETISFDSILRTLKEFKVRFYNVKSVNIFEFLRSVRNFYDVYTLFI